MDSGAYKILLTRFGKMVDQPKLQSEYPEQFQKHWENQGKSGRVQIFSAKIIDYPCDITFSLFFSGDEVIQTGVLIKYQDEAIVNEVRKGDAINYCATKRVDPVAFLKANWGSGGAAGGEAVSGPVETESFALVLDDDAEPEVFRAVQQLTGYSQEELREIWQGLIDSNDQRPGLDRVGPIIKTWLKKVRDKLDLQYLQDAEILQLRSADVQHFTAHDRSYTVVCKRERGSVIRERIDHADPEWWGGAFYTMRGDELVRMPHEQKDRVLLLKSFDYSMDFPVEEIFVDNRHVYSVIFVGEEAIVWRTRQQVTAEVMGVPLAPSAVKPKRMEKFVSRFRRKPSAEPGEGAEVMQAEMASDAAASHHFVMARAEKTYTDALAARAPDVGDRRREFMKLLYESDKWRFHRHREELRFEMQTVAAKVLSKDAAASHREGKLIEAQVTLLYAEIE